MPPPKKTPPSPVKSNVHRLVGEPVKVKPPGDWQFDGEFGHMAFEPGDAGKLVRLAEVLRWLQLSRGIPRVAALELLCGAMPAEFISWLYWLQPSDYAKPVPSNYAFDYKTAEQIAAQKVQDRQNAIKKGLELERSHGRYGVPAAMVGGRISLGYLEPTVPGLPALLKRLKSLWVLTKLKTAATCDVLDDPRTGVHALAIRLDKAHELWGFGQVVGHPPIDTPATHPLPSRVLVKDMAPDWPGERLYKQQELLKAEGKRDFAKLTAQLAKLEQKESYRRILAYRESLTTHTARNSVFDTAKKPERR